MEVKKGVSKSVIIGCIIIIILIVCIVAGAFYIYYGSPEEVYQESLTGGNISLTYSDEENLFAIEKAIPTSDIEGKKYDSADLFYDFTVKVDIEDANVIEYEILLVKDETLSNALNSNIKVYLEKEDSGTYVQVAGPEIFNSNVEDEKIGDSVMSVYKEKRTESGNDNYRLRMWVSDTANITPGELQNYAVKIALKGAAK